MRRSGAARVPLGRVYLMLHAVTLRTLRMLRTLPTPFDAPLPCLRMRTTRKCAFIPGAAGRNVQVRLPAGCSLTVRGPGTIIGDGHTMIRAGGARQLVEMSNVTLIHCGSATRFGSLPHNSQVSRSLGQQTCEAMCRTACIVRGYSLARRIAMAACAAKPRSAHHPSAHHPHACACACACACALHPSAHHPVLPAQARAPAAGRCHIRSR